ncbi:type I secretion membrane fusion protein, HlyD family [Janthinobacterium lividum]|uniref:hypothetical protein n=1 Tax=Janthinobacterium lividum TaxID=29581 RepID=UPI000E030408|nr:hypothetical protein [Janthinobacterium lividum]STQ92821.1 type I secretion membrane fusion protein, HlyD family [Janthinobacterium lividum]
MKLAKVEAKEEAKRGRVLIWSCTAALAGVIAWASWAELDQVTRANGQVIASSRNQIIQVADGGVLAELRVHEGSVVKKEHCWRASTARGPRRATWKARPRRPG